MDSAPVSAKRVCRLHRSMDLVVPPLDPINVARLAQEGIKLEALAPIGARAEGVDLKTPSKLSAEAVEALQQEMARRGFIVFPNQGILSGDEQIAASKLWGSHEMHSPHGHHPQSPSEHILRVSNDRDQGMAGVGPQWHCDGSFEVGVFSHVGYHIVALPEKGGDTMFAHLGAAFDALPPQKQARWSRMVSINATSGVLHPLVYDHPISGTRSVFLHLGMTGGILEKLPGDANFRLLEHDEMVELMSDYNQLLKAGLPSNGGNYATGHAWQQGDMVFTDNLAIAHKASTQAHADPSTHGLRIIHRSTVKAMHEFLPGFGLPAVFNRQLSADAIANGSSDNGILLSGANGFEWDRNEPIRNMATDYQKFYKTPIDMDWLRLAQIG